MTVIVSRKWRESNNISEKHVYRAGVEACCVDYAHHKRINLYS